MEEIKIQYKSLDDHIRALRNLAKRLKDRNFLTTKLLNESEGDTCQALNETYEILCEIEQSLKQRIVATADWLEGAKISFLEAEHKTIFDVNCTLNS